MGLEAIFPRWGWFAAGSRSKLLRELLPSTGGKARQMSAGRWICLVERVQRSKVLDCPFYHPVAISLRAALIPHFWYLSYAAAARSRICWLSSPRTPPSTALFRVYASGAIRLVVHSRGYAPDCRTASAK